MNEVKTYTYVTLKFKICIHLKFKKLNQGVE